MKKMDTKNMQAEELNEKLKENQEKLRMFRFGASGAKTKNVKEGMLTRKNIARILTEQKLRSLKK